MPAGYLHGDLQGPQTTFYLHNNLGPEGSQGMICEKCEWGLLCSLGSGGENGGSRWCCGSVVCYIPETLKDP